VKHRFSKNSQGFAHCGQIRSRNQRIYPTTGKKYYDLNKNPVISPYTGEVVRIAPIAPIPPPRTRADAAARARAAAAASAAEATPEPVEAEELVPLEPIIFLAEQGMGIAYLPDFAIGRQLREGVLVTCDDYTDHSGPFRVLWPSSRHLAPKLRVFVDFLVANLGPAVEGESDKAGDSRISS
jgi:uncharacterized protein (TIGR02300 family)